MFSGCTVLPHSKETKFRSSHQEASSSTGKNTEIAFVPYCDGSVSLQLFPVLWICLRSLGVICSGGSDEFSGRVTKNYFKAWSLTNSQPTFLFLTYFLTQWIMALLSKGCKPDNFQPHNSLKLSFTNIWGLDLIFLDLNLSLNQTLLTFLLYMRQTWITQVILVISLWEFIFLYAKRFNYSYAWSRSLCETRASFYMGLISRKLSGFLLMFSTGFTLLCLTSFSSIDHLPLC